MRRFFFFCQLHETDICTAFFFHLSEAVNPIHTCGQKCFQHHEIIMSLIAAMLFQVLVMICLLHNLKECPHRIIFINHY